MTNTQGLATTFIKSRLQAKKTAKPVCSGLFSHQVAKSSLRQPSARGAIACKRKSLISLRESGLTAMVRRCGNRGGTAPTTRYGFFVLSLTNPFLKPIDRIDDNGRRRTYAATALRNAFGS